ncbi:hypothetical protein A45J_2604 [hot springs metagenome]|uniref:Uncharacterized protein n=1 Tax=hot springs metagenome TaxID=433727 RepID=A0A5J4KZ11_9ZZZZ
MKGTTIYAKNSGVEIKAATAVKTEDGGAIRKEGRVQMRFFTFGNGTAKSLRFILTVFEAFGLYLSIYGVVKNGGKKSLVHKFTKDDVEVKTYLTVEKWQNGDKSGYALVLSRGDDKVNVPVSESDLLYTAELLKALSVDQAWSSYKNADGTEAEEDIPADELPAGPSELAEEIAAESAPSPMEKNNDGESITGKIKSVRKDRKGFCIGDTWYKVDDNTELSGLNMDDARGKEVTVHYTSGNGDNANPVAVRVAA